VVNPAEFIPLAERTGLIHRIGHWVVQRALTDWAELRSFCNGQSHERAFVSVNLSSPELVGGEVAKKIGESLQLHGVDPRELRIELTETTVIDNMQAVARTLDELRGTGIGIALDDFGTGYAGLDYLQSLPFTCIKIDKTFVQQMHQSERSVHIVKAALALAKSIGLSTIAEGIEEQAVGAQLAAMGCSHAQGYHFGKPMPKVAIGAWHAQHAAKYWA
jgi:EAL domain-containing protein (putative c-di-GMP-specific phosphodiesterase class I)